MAISRKGGPAGRKLGDCAHPELLPSGRCKGCGSLPGCEHQLREAEDGWLGCVRPGCGFRRSVKAPLLVTVAIDRRRR
jgi:hypothetical protein